MSNFRSQRLRDLAKECPHCMNFACRKPNDGSIVGAHIPFGKDRGMSLKPSDLLAYLCFDCHNIVDGRVDMGYTKAERLALWMDAQWWTTLWLIQSDHLVVK